MHIRRINFRGGVDIHINVPHCTIWGISPPRPPGIYADAWEINLVSPVVNSFPGIWPVKQLKRCLSCKLPFKETIIVIQSILSVIYLLALLEQWHLLTTRRGLYHFFRNTLKFMLIRNSAIADKPRDASRGQSRSPNVVPFDRLCMVSYSNFVRKPVQRPSILLREILDFRNAVILKTRLGVRQGHWKCHHSIESLWLPIE